MTLRRQRTERERDARCTLRAGQRTEGAKYAEYAGALRGAIPARPRCFFLRTSDLAIGSLACGCGARGDRGGPCCGLLAKKPRNGGYFPLNEISMSHMRRPEFLFRTRSALYIFSTTTLRIFHSKFFSQRKERGLLL